MIVRGVMISCVWFNELFVVIGLLCEVCGVF